jgi:hypothetical protein
MKKALFIITILLAVSETASCQDTTAKPLTKPGRRKEIGVSILTPLILMAGTQDQSGRYTNVTFRYRFTFRRAVRAFVGFASNNPPYPSLYEAGVVTNSTTTYEVVVRTRPSNFQAGIGYEYMVGERLKQVPAIDLVYANLFEKDEHTFVKYSSNVDSTGGGSYLYERIDSTRSVYTQNYDKIGINLSYSLRYELSRKWIITASIVAAYRYTRRGAGKNAIVHQDFDIIGPLSDISIFYRF